MQQQCLRSKTCAKATVPKRWPERKVSPEHAAIQRVSDDPRWYAEGDTTHQAATGDGTSTAGYTSEMRL